MTEVPAQTPPPAQPGVVPPTGQGTAAPAPPAGDTPNPNPTNNPGANTEMQPGAGGGVDLEKMDANGYEALISRMEADDFDDEDEAVPEAAPAAAGTAPAAAPAAPTPNAEALPGAPSDEDTVLPPGQMPHNIKVPTGDDPLAFQTARFFKESRLGGGTLTFGQAESLAKKFLGMPDEAAPAGSATEVPASTQEATPQTAPTGGKTSDELLQRLEALETEFGAASEAFDPTEQARIMKNMNRLNREIAQAITVEAQQEAQASVAQVDQRRQFLTEWESQRDRAYGMFAHANAADPASPLHQKAVEIQDQYRSSQDAGEQAIAQSTQSVAWFFNLAAQELGITPGAVPAASQPNPQPQNIQSPTKSTPSSTPPPQRPVGAALISGSPAGTTQQPAAAGQFLVDNIRDVHSLEALIHALPKGA